MAKRRKKRKKKNLTPRNVLSGKVNASALELVRMIHRVNPTARDISGHEAKERYRLKSELQSLLINRFGDSLEIQADDLDNPDIVSIRLRHFDEDACHAVVRELDDSARKRIYHQISFRGSAEESVDRADVGREDGNMRTSGDKDATLDEDRDIHNMSAAELLKAGRKALDEYDYERCDRYLTLAFEQSEGHPDAAGALLEFLVDIVADYPRAIEIFQSLPAYLREDTTIMEIGAVALARSGHIDSALDMLSGYGSERAVDVCIQAAREFISQGAVDRAKEYLGILKKHAGEEKGPEIRPIEAELQKIGMRQLEPMIREMQELWDQGMREQAAAMASSVLEQWPDNSPAREVRRKYASWKKEAAISELLSLADRAHADRRFSDEAEYIRRILDMKGARDPALSKRVDEALASARHARTEADIKKVLKLLGQGKMHEAMEYFALLDGQVRRRILETSRDKRLAHLERILNAPAKIKHGRAIEAVLEFHKVLDLTGQSLESAIAMLEKYREILEILPEARDFFRKASEEIQAKRKQEARTLLEKAEEIAKDGGSQECIAILGQISSQYLEIAERRRLEQLKQAMEHRLRKQLIERQLDRAVSSEEWLAARNLCSQIISLEEAPSFSASWSRKKAFFNSKLREQWKFTILEPDGNHHPYFQNMLDLYQTEPSISIMPDLGILLLCRSYHRWIFILAFHLSRQEYTRAVVFRSPVPMDSCEFKVRGHEVWLSSQHGLIILEYGDDVEILDMHFLEGFRAKDKIDVNAMCFPDAARLWLVQDDLDFAGTDIAIYNIEKRIIDRRIKTESWPSTVNRCGNSFVAWKPDYDGRITIYNAYGKEPAILELPETFRHDMFGGITVHPDCAGYVAGVYGEFVNTEDNSEISLIVLSQIDSSDAASHVTARDTDGEAVHLLGTSVRHNVVFLYAAKFTEVGLWQLFGFKLLGNGTLKQLYSVPAPRRLAFFTVENSSRVYVMGTTAEGPRVLELDQSPPELGRYNVPGKFNEGVPDTSFKFVDCDLFTSEIKSMSENYLQELETDRVSILMNIDQFKQSNASPENTLSFIRALEQKHLFQESAELRKWFYNKFPAHPYARLKEAEKALEAQQWEQVLKNIETMDRSVLPDQWASHACHLLGIALIATGKPEKASQVFMEGMSLQNCPCDLDELVELADAMSSHEPGSPSAMPRAWYILQEIDKMQESGNWSGIIDMLEQECLVSEDNLQLLARLASAWLHIEVTAGTSRWLCKMLVLARFCKEKSEKYISPPMMLPDFIREIPETELDGLEEEAKAFLEKQQSSIQ